jgi:hypothetical protein
MARPNGPTREGWVHSVSSGHGFSRAKSRRIPSGYLRSPPELVVGVRHQFGGPVVRAKEGRALVA